MTQQATAKASQPADRTLEEMLTAWQTGDEAAWSELMTAWLQAPAAPRSPETVARLIKHLDSK